MSSTFSNTPPLGLGTVPEVWGRLPLVLALAFGLPQVLRRLGLMLGLGLGLTLGLGLELGPILCLRLLGLGLGPKPIDRQAQTQTTTPKAGRKDGVLKQKAPKDEVPVSCSVQWCGQ